jgi:hypothetical protein
VEFNVTKERSIMKKILALIVTIAVSGACVPQKLATPGQRPQSAAQNAPASLAAPVQDTALFWGKGKDEVYAAAKMALAECGYALKTSDKDSGLLLASKGTEPNAPVATVLVLTDANGIPSVKVQYMRPGQSDTSPAANRSAIEQILGAIRGLLK